MYSPTTFNFDQNTSRMKQTKMFVKCELPLEFVENEDFHGLLWSYKHDLASHHVVN